MTTKSFYIDDIEHTVTILNYTPGHPAKTNCDPDDGYEGSDWEIEFEDVVDVEDKDSVVFDDFIHEYARDHFGGDEKKALLRVESDCQEEIMDTERDY